MNTNNQQTKQILHELRSVKLKMVEDRAVNALDFLKKINVLVGKNKNPEVINQINHLRKEYSHSQEIDDNLLNIIEGWIIKFDQQ